MAKARRDSVEATAARFRAGPRKHKCASADDCRGFYVYIESIEAVIRAERRRAVRLLRARVPDMDGRQDCVSEVPGIVEEVVRAILATSTKPKAR